MGNEDATLFLPNQENPVTLDELAGEVRLLRAQIAGLEQIVESRLRLTLPLGDQLAAILAGILEIKGELVEIKARLTRVEREQREITRHVNEAKRDSATALTRIDELEIQVETLTPRS